MGEMSKYRGPAAFRVDPAEGPSWLTFRCEEDLRESGVITDGDKVVALIELLALRERAEPAGYRKLFTCSSCGAEGLDEPLESRCHCNGDGARWIEGRLYTAPPAPVVAEGLRIALSNAGIAAPESDEMLWASQQDYIQMLVTWVKDRKPFKHAPVVPEWTNQQCLEFLSVAFRHAEIKGDFELDDLRLGVKMANAMTPVKEVN
ncbi:hypothetical protein AAAW32_003474 [Cronobacter sakazakii]